jgi:hypothetical protein
VMNAIDYFDAKNTSTGYYDDVPGWPGESGGEGDVSDWCTCDNGEGFASGVFRLKVCRKDDNCGIKGIDVFFRFPGNGVVEERPYGWLRGDPVRCECRSDKFVCMRRMATPPSSTEKLKPRCGVTCPVDISVRLPLRQSPE